MTHEINLDLMRAELVSVIRRLNMLEDEHSKCKIRRMEDHKKIADDQHRIDELIDRVAYLMKAEEERRNP